MHETKPPARTVSVVICAHRSRHRLEKTLPPWAALSRVHEVIVVDAPSGDGTAELVRTVAEHAPIPVRLISAPLRGLANARNVGTAAATGEHVLHAGPDNILPGPVLEEMLEKLAVYDLVSCSTVLAEPRSYFDRAHDLSKRRLPVGEILTAVGTPYVAPRRLFIENPFNESMRHADDTELCARLLAKELSIYRSSLTCLEVGYTSLSDLRERWGRWGASDSQFHQQMKHAWSVRRRAKSLSRAFIAEVLEPRQVLKASEYVYGLPFFLIAALFRTQGRVGIWLRRTARGPE